MSGHSKWATIKHKKAAQDQARGKIFTRHAKLIEIAARKGSDPTMNSALRTAIDNAKIENVPNVNIDRAIKKGSGTLKDAAMIEEVIYEAFGPEGIALIVTCLTDNRNRTLSHVRTIITKPGGRMGENGSVNWLFKRKGVLEIALGVKSEEEIELAAIDAGAEEIETDNEDQIRVICSAENFQPIKEKLLAQGLTINKTHLDLLPDTYVKISDPEKAKRILNMMEQLEADDDVDSVASNFDIDEKILAQAMA